jgi:hypothetical protein
MSYYQDHTHVEPARDQFRSGASPESYGSVVGTIEQSTEHPITGRSGDHLQFDVQIGNGISYQVDVNTHNRRMGLQSSFTLPSRIYSQSDRIPASHLGRRLMACFSMRS